MVGEASRESFEDGVQAAGVASIPQANHYADHCRIIIVFGDLLEVPVPSRPYTRYPGTEDA